MDVVFEGALSRSWGMKDVLKALTDVPNVPLGVLRVSCPSKKIQGKVLVSQAQHVIGAVLSESQDEHAYEILRTLLEVTDGNFAFLDVGGEAPAEFDQSLFICIKRILSVMPHLPESASDMFEQSKLLDQVFGEAYSPSPVPVPTSKDYSSFPLPMPHLRACKSAPASKKSTEAPVTQWNIVEPLFDNPEAMHTDHAECCSMIPEYVQTQDEQRSSMNRLRTLPSPSQTQISWQRAIRTPQQPIKWILAALGLSIAICFVTAQLWNNTAVKPQRISEAALQPIR